MSIEGETVSKDSQIKPWQSPIDTFVLYAEGGKNHQATGQKLPGEDNAETPLRMGELNGYSYQDIAYFYLWRRRGDPESGYLEFMFDARFEGKNLSDSTWKVLTRQRRKETHEP